MTSGPSTASAIAGQESLRERFEFWVLLRGDRLVVAGGILVAVVTVVAVFIAAGLIDVGARSSAATVFGSGLTSGVVTIVTIALSVNQLILSRVFGSPSELADRLDGTTELRRTVEELAGASSSPNDPAAFLKMTAAALRDRAVALDRAIEASEWSPPESVESDIDTLVDYGENIVDHLHDQADIVDVIGVVVGTEYARNLTAVRHLRDANESALTEDVRREFDAVEDLLESIAIARQFFKTMSLQEDFARLSRLLAYTGLMALVATFSLTLVYRSSSTTVPPGMLLPVVSIGFGVVVAPVALFVAYILRAATIAKRTVSVGPFVPPEAE